jgi:transposase
MGFDVYNRTSLHLEEKICTLARQMPEMGTRELSWRIESITGERIDQSTVYRILKRNKVRYTRDTEYVRRKSLKRYSLEIPGQEIQLDVCFPF